MSRGLYVKRIIVALMLCLGTMSVYPQAKRALLVGISDYPQESEGAWSPIHGANDVDLILPTLEAQGFRVTKMCDKEAKANKVRKKLVSMVSSCGKGDMVYLHFSMHGQPVEDFDMDEPDGWDEAIIPFDAKMIYQSGEYEGDNHITDDELHGYIQDIREAIGNKGFLCVVIDACHAGSSFRGDEEEDEVYLRGTKRGFTPNEKDYRPRINAQSNFTIPADAALANVIILEACRSYQSNYEIKQDGKYYGPLSYYVTKTLKTYPLSSDIAWVLNVKRLMGADNRLVRQNMVYETSLK